ncbi:hypothetical protein FisN_1Lh244 [Fistulifera solaris]|uniref:Uncharacterized protein n=1 Tax=Fistulifera solaris TaxID=1519565 RepID=A0A1Z5K4C7_FISSO|nr:hypothetical protein FisN_1Lh244 [Fistulifera solaris]|eukprot:GAX21083.1 hypothetical protein FisN_1Lh244 [Fistulifera solaris]
MMYSIRYLVLALVGSSLVTAFQPVLRRCHERVLTNNSSQRASLRPLFARRTLTKDKALKSDIFLDVDHETVLGRCDDENKIVSHFSRLTTAAATTATALTVASTDVMAKTDLGTMTPQEFQPVCPTSDIIYRLLQSSVLSIVGKDNFIEYAPLISGGLLRVRLEICVVESFFEEAIGPFIEKNGFNWILPVHETVETFLAGTIFAAATSFILIGSTKIVSVIATYVDFLIGLPTRTLGGFVYDRATGKPVTLDIGIGQFKTRVIGPPKEEEENFVKGDLNFVKVVVLILSGVTKFFGQVVGAIQQAIYALDTFVGKYLFLWATLYILVKFVHFKVFPDFP